MLRLAEGTPDAEPLGAASTVAAIGHVPAEARFPEGTKRIVRDLFLRLEARGVRHVHWKSNIRLERTLAGGEDVDILVDRRDAGLLQSVLAEGGFKLARSRSGVDHPGVFHAIGLDEDAAELVDVHAYFQVVSGDSLVKNYRLPIDDVLLERTRVLHGVRVPAVEAELLLFVLRIALKHVSPVEILKVSRGYGKVAAELAWLRAAADPAETETLIARLDLPGVDAALVRRLADAVAHRRALPRRVLLGCLVAWRLRRLRRLGWPRAAASRLWRVACFAADRLRRRRDLALEAGGTIIALVGPKASGKSTIGRELAARLGRHLAVERVHAGKPPATVLSFLPRLFVPLARRLLPGERLGEYEKPERRARKTYSLFYVARMTLLAYDRRRLLFRALRSTTSGAIVLSDRYPSVRAGAIDSSCFDDEALVKAGPGLKRRLMRLERALYDGLPRARLVLQLAAPLDVAILRDAERVKPGGPNAEAVRRRWELESRAEFGATPVVRLDTGRPLDETVRAAVRAAWEAL